jgi:hypothetical protein
LYSLMNPPRPGLAKRKGDEKTNKWCNKKEISDHGR